MGIEIPAITYARGIKAMFAVGCFAGLIKVLAGSNAILLADLMMFCLVFLFNPHPEPGINIKDGFVIKSALFLSAALLGLGLCQSFNPNVPNPATGLFYYRISSYPILCIFIGHKLRRAPSMVPGILNFVLAKLTPINAAYALVQSFHLDPLSVRLVKHLGWGQFGALGTYRVTGFLQGPMQLGLLCAMGAGVYLARSVFLEKWKAGNTALLLILFISLVASMSRASLLGFLTLSLLVCVILLPRLSRKRHMYSFVGHLAFLSLIPISIIAYVGDLETVDILSSRIETLSNVGQDNSFKEGRINNWKHKVLPALLKNPLGRGNGSTGTVRPEGEAPYSMPVMETESLYFAMAMELGWAGFIMILLLFAMSLAGIILILKSNPCSPGIEVAAIIWIFAFAGITSPNMSAFPVTWLFFFSFPFALEVLDLKVASLAWRRTQQGSMA